MEIDLKTAGELMSEIAQNEITPARFRFNCAPQAALNMLVAAYMNEVRKRRMEFRLDANTQDALIRLADALTKENPKFGVLCCGVCGNGKTTLLRAFQKVLNIMNGTHALDWLKGFDTTMPIVDAKDLLHIAKDHDKFVELRGRDMLAIDDMGKEAAETMYYGNFLSPVVDLIEYRYERQLFTFLTTNLPLNSANGDAMTIRKKYGGRIADRFNEMLEVIVFKDVSYRELAR